MKNYLTFDIGGTFVKWALINSNYEILKNDKWEFKGKIEGAKVLIKKIKEKIEEIKKTSNIDAIGISTAGTVDPKTKMMVGETFNIKDMKNLNFQKELKKIIDCPIFVENDANAATIGETTQKSLNKFENLLMITLGTGIGAGIIINKKLYRGLKGLAGEIGNHYYKGQRWEYYYSTIGLLRMVKEKNNLDLSTYQILESNDLKIKKTLDDWYDGIAHVLANLILLMNFEAIVIGGGISESKSFDLKKINEKIITYLAQSQFHNSFKIFRAKLGNQAAIIGLAKIINDELNN